MSEPTIKIFSPSKQYIGYFVNPKVEFFPDQEYDFEGNFLDANGKPVEKLEYNPESLPYTAELDGMANIKDKHLHQVYIQRSRPPIKMSGRAQ